MVTASVAAGAIAAVAAAGDVGADGSESSQSTCGDLAVTLAGTARSDHLIGTAGRDVIDGRGGDDVLAGGAGDDVICGGPGSDTLTGGAGDDLLNGGAGPDDASYGGDLLGPVTVDLRAGVATGGSGSDRLVALEGVYGTIFDDTLSGNATANRLYGDRGADVVEGGDGDDLILGDRGDDRLSGGPGNDVLTPGAGADSVDGGAGESDTAAYDDAPGGVDANLAAETASGAGGQDTLGGLESLRGSIYDDRLIGDETSNLLAGNAGDDVVSGGGGSDFVGGGSGRDTVAAGGGIDYCLDAERRSACESVGLPGGGPPPPIFGRPSDRLLERAGATDEPLGDARCRRRDTGARPPAKPGKGRRRPSHVTRIAPPIRLSAKTGALARRLASPGAQGQERTAVTWEPVLFRSDGRRVKVVRRGTRARGLMDSSGAVTWVDSRGNSMKPVPARVGVGRYAWAVRIRTGRRLLAYMWSEPTTDERKSASRFQPECRFGR